MRVPLETMDPQVALEPLDSREIVVSPVPPDPQDCLEPPDPLDPLELLVALETVESLVLPDPQELLGLLEPEVLLDPPV